MHLSKKHKSHFVQVGMSLSRAFDETWISLDEKKNISC